MSNTEWNRDPALDQDPHRAPTDADATVVLPASAHAPPPQPSSPPPPPPPPPSPPPPAYPPYPQAPSYGTAPAYGQPPAPGYAPAPGYGAAPFGAPHAPRTYRSPGGSITMIVGALLAILGTFLPWLTFGEGDFSASVNGYETYVIGEGFDATEWVNPGAYVLGAMVIVIAMAIIILAAGRSTATWILGIIAAALGGLMTLGALGAVASVLDQDIFGSLTIGVGIVLCMVGAAVAGVGAVVVAAKKS